MDLPLEKQKRILGGHLLGKDRQWHTVARFTFRPGRRVKELLTKLLENFSGVHCAFFPWGPAGLPVESRSDGGIQRRRERGHDGFSG